MLKKFRSERDFTIEALLQEEICYFLYTLGNSYSMHCSLCPSLHPESNTWCRKKSAVCGLQPRFHSRCIITVNLKEIWQSTLLQEAWEVLWGARPMRKN